jgi:toxin-antitoxin system PIN domain toxin
MLVDANILLYAADRTSPFHPRAAEWLEEKLNAPRRVALPWPTLTAFLRITTHPRALDRPLTPTEAWQFVGDWLACDNVWIPLPTERHADVLAGLLATYDLRGNLVADADLAALAIEHGLEICSADTDFARFREVRWTNPVAAQ